MNDMQHQHTAGRASQEQLQQLWGLVLGQLKARMGLPKRQPVDLLAVARRFLRDNGAAATSEAEAAELRRLYRAYSKALAEALDADDVSAAVLAEARQWLTYQGIRADLPAAQAKQVASALASLDLPFTTKH